MGMGEWDLVASLHKENSLVRLFRWIYAGVDRTIFMGLKFTFPTRFVSPLGFLGMLTFVLFIILGISGALLMLWYEPILDRAWDSVENINDTIPYGFHLRNIHYHASNAMVMMAILHMYYQYFSGRYKIRNEILWVTGILIGVLTILEAFTGYDIIFSERAELAISIAASLTNCINRFNDCSFPSLSCFRCSNGYGSHRGNNDYGRSISS